MEALKNLNGRFYAGRQIVAEFSPVTEFREARYGLRCCPWPLSVLRLLSRVCCVNVFCIVAFRRAVRVTLAPRLMPLFMHRSCRQFDESHCARGAFCNFMHLKAVPRDLLRDLQKGQPHAGENKRGGAPERERSPP